MFVRDGVFHCQQKKPTRSDQVKNLPDRKSGCKLLKIGIFRKLKESVIP
ncbi:hypothetical protein D922_02345 [Enterococcus faecalis 06-MB-DW-09]|nr:hypothetical protein D922_02345 [Enterococcus faecalis 06-MB-DW-09]